MGDFEYIHVDIHWIWPYMEVSHSSRSGAFVETVKSEQKAAGEGEKCYFQLRSVVHDWP